MPSANLSPAASPIFILAAPIGTPLGIPRPASSAALLMAGLAV